jgi:putative phosphotransacetylase
VIIAKRHIHFTPDDAAKFGIADKQLVKIRVDGPRSLVFDEVVARVRADFATYAHFDYDEMNAAGLYGSTTTGEILV